MCFGLFYFTFTILCWIQLLISKTQIPGNITIYQFCLCHIAFRNIFFYCILFILLHLHYLILGTALGDIISKIQSQKIFIFIKSVYAIFPLQNPVFWFILLHLHYRKLGTALARINKNKCVTRRPNYQ